jgi:hypothetical protein
VHHLVMFAGIIDDLMAKGDAAVFLAIAELEEQE